jgi:hypothetical protein
VLARIELDEQLERSIDQTGLLEVTFSATKSDSSVTSLDGNRTVAWMLPSGELGSLLVQDYTSAPGRRSIPFVFGSIELINDGITLIITLESAP